MKQTAALTPCPLSRVAGEGERPSQHTRSTSLSQALGEGLGVRAKDSGRAPYEGFVSLETPTGIINMPVSLQESGRHRRN